MQLRSGKMVSSIHNNVIQSCKTTQITEWSEMNRIVGPIIHKISNMTNIKSVKPTIIRNLPLIIELFQMINLCDFDKIIQNTVDSPDKVKRFMLVVCSKSTEFTYTIIEYIYENFKLCKYTDLEKHNFITALTILHNTKQCVMDMVQKFESSGPAKVSFYSVEYQNTYEYVTIRRTITDCVYPIYTINAFGNELCTPTDIFNHNFINKNMLSYIYVMCKYEYQVLLSNTSSNIVFRERKCKTVAGALMSVSKLENDITYPYLKKTIKSKRYTLDQHLKSFTSFLY
jgi:hypothetical protein